MADALVRCAVCDGPTSVVFNKHGYDIVGCLSCGHRQVRGSFTEEHADVVYDDSYFFGGGSGYPDYLTEGALLRRAGQRYAELLSEYTAPGTLMDIGAAAGFVLRGFMDAGWTGVGIEPNERMARVAREVNDAAVRVGKIESLQEGTQYDLVTMIQVIGHFYDLRRALLSATELVVPNGLLLIESWDRSSLPARLLGAGWHEYSPPSVLHWFTPRELQRLMEGHGFEELRRGRPSKRISGSHARSLLRDKLPRWLAPITSLIPPSTELKYPPLDLFWSLYRKSP